MPQSETTTVELKLRMATAKNDWCFDGKSSEKKKKNSTTKAIINSVGMTTSKAHNYHWHALDKLGPRMKSQIV